MATGQYTRNYSLTVVMVTVDSLLMFSGIPGAAYMPGWILLLYKNHRYSGDTCKEKGSSPESLRS